MRRCVCCCCCCCLLCAPFCCNFEAQVGRRNARFRLRDAVEEGRSSLGKSKSTELVGRYARERRSSRGGGCSCVCCLVAAGRRTCASWRLVGHVGRAVVESLACLLDAQTWGLLRSHWAEAHECGLVLLSLLARPNLRQRQGRRKAPLYSCRQDDDGTRSRANSAGARGDDRSIG